VIPRTRRTARIPRHVGAATEAGSVARALRGPPSHPVFGAAPHRPGARRRATARGASPTAEPAARFAPVPVPRTGAGEEEEAAVPTYIAFGDWTDQGVRAVRESPGRLDAAKRQLEEMGGRFVAFWMTMGGHDMCSSTRPRTTPWRRASRWC
jgi:GYD domain